MKVILKEKGKNGLYYLGFGLGLTSEFEKAHHFELKTVIKLISIGDVDVLEIPKGVERTYYDPLVVQHLETLISTVQGYQNMPGYSLHPMSEAALETASKFVEENT